MPDLKKCIIKTQGSREVWAKASIYVHKCHGRDLPSGDEKGRYASPWPLIAMGLAMRMDPFPHGQVAPIQH